ncbi:shikimate kinase [Bacillus salipaludis]|uniref:Shikimate kinase n=1 Tax=Bacillus salipaludis TaxID=2547811 RepID=A0ABW8RN85_9BACI
MGVGKTTIGKLVGEKLDRDFIDVDEEIEKEYDMKVSEIFNKIGEKAFREKEKSVITGLCEQKGKILSLGGGAFLQEDIRKVCLSSSFVIFLDLSFEKWKERISLIIDSRPVLQGKSIAEMEELFNKRQEVYAKHHLKVNTDDQAPEEIADLIIHAVNEKV